MSNALIYGDLYLENYRRKTDVTADFFVRLDMLNITAKFRQLQTRFKKKLLILEPEVTKPEVLQGLILIERTMNFIIKTKER